MENIQPTVLTRTPSRSYSVVIAHSNEIVRLGLERMFGEIGPVRRVESCASLEATRALSNRRPPDGPALEPPTMVTVVAHALVEDGVDHSCGRWLADMTTLLLLESLPRQHADVSLSNSWADGFLVEKSLSSNVLCDALSQLERGQFPMPSGMTRSLLAELRDVRHGGPSGPHLLTQREIEALTLIAQGRSNKQIARQLNIGVNGVKRHVSNLLAKLNCPNRTQAAAYAVRAGLITRSEHEGR